MAISRPTGFTVTEILVTLGLIAFMSALAMPVITTYRPALALKASARQLIADLRYTQQLTVTQQAVHYLEVTASSTAYKIYRSGTPPTLLKTGTLDAGITVTSITGPADGRFHYNSYGAVSTAGSITLRNANGTTQIVHVRPSGYVQMGN